MTYYCKHCSRQWDKKYARDSHQETCYRQWFKFLPPSEPDHYIYIFTFVFNGLQRYYIGETIHPEQRMHDHCWGETKKIFDGKDVVVAQPEDIRPLNGHIVDTADNKTEAQAKERWAFVKMLKQVEDSSMVCGGR